MTVLMQAVSASDEQLVDKLRTQKADQEETKAQVEDTKAQVEAALVEVGAEHFLKITQLTQIEELQIHGVVDVAKHVNVIESQLYRQTVAERMRGVRYAGIGGHGCQCI